MEANTSTQLLNEIMEKPLAKLLVELGVRIYVPPQNLVTLGLYQEYFYVDRNIDLDLIVKKIQSLFMSFGCTFAKYNPDKNSVVGILKKGKNIIFHTLLLCSPLPQGDSDKLEVCFSVSS